MKKKAFVFLLFFGLVSYMGFAQYANQVGFHPKSVKHIFLQASLAEKLIVVKNRKGKRVFSTLVSDAKIWPPSQTRVCVADVSELKEEGEYTFECEGIKGRFSIDKKVYGEIGKTVLKSFYMARVSEEILAKYAGEYARPLGHKDDAVVIHKTAASAGRPAGSTISSPGGWYDAGDYGKYVVNSGISTYSVLHVYDMFSPHLKKVHVNIPESGNGVSDVLNEAIVNLKWMLTMQDPADGGVYHKLTALKFGPFVMPYENTADRYVMMKTTAASLDLAAVAAKAYRILRAFEKPYPGLANQCLAVATKAYQWSLKNPNVLYVQPDDVNTGKYGDKKIKDEWFWAKVELFLSTKDVSYLEGIDLNHENFATPSWGKVNTLGLLSMLKKDVASDPTLDKQVAHRKITQLADSKVAEYQSSAYHVPIKKFAWGSNSDVANDGMVLLHAYLVSGKQKYLEAADACAGYILGANPLDMCFVTGFGRKSPMFPHERRSASDGIAAPIPGLMVGGPTNSVQRDCGEHRYPSKLPALSYADMQCSFSTNEIAINWQGAATFLFLGLDAVYNGK